MAAQVIEFPTALFAFAFSACTAFVIQIKHHPSSIHAFICLPPSCLPPVSLLSVPRQWRGNIACHPLICCLPVLCVKQTDLASLKHETGRKKEGADRRKRSRQTDRMVTRPPAFFLHMPFAFPSPATPASLLPAPTTHRCTAFAPHTTAPAHTLPAPLSISNNPSSYLTYLKLAP